MNSTRRIGVLTTLAGATLALGSLTLAPAAHAADANWTDHTGQQNITECPSGTQYVGQTSSGTDSTALFTWTVTDATYVSITAIDPSVTGLTAYIKGGDGYRVYSPVVSGQLMRSPDNNGGNVPTLSHWFLCYGVTEVTTTTAEVTTTTAEVTTTTAEATTTTAPATTTPAPTPPPTTTVAETTTTAESGGPTTTIADESGGPTTTIADGSGGPTTTAGSTLPHTGSGSTMLLGLGALLAVIGLALTIGARAPRQQ